MTKKGYEEDFIFAGKCNHCGAEFEAEKDQFKGSRHDQNCDFCGHIRSVRFHPAQRKQMLNEG